MAAAPLREHPSVRNQPVVRNDQSGAIEVSNPVRRLVGAPVLNPTPVTFQGAKRGANSLRQPTVSSDVQPHSRCSAAHQATLGDTRQRPDRDWGSRGRGFKSRRPDWSTDFFNFPFGEPIPR
jgi:hypothetical protein